MAYFVDHQRKNPLIIFRKLLKTTKVYSIKQRIVMTDLKAFFSIIFDRTDERAFSFMILTLCLKFFVPLNRIILHKFGSIKKRVTVVTPIIGTFCHFLSNFPGNVPNSFFLIKFLRFLTRSSIL